MRLVGFEVENYGPFNAQYIPIVGGVTVLAGYNNAGKTCILRAITTLSGGQALPYLRPDHQSTLSTFYELEPKDLVNINAPNHAAFIPDGMAARVKATFRMRDPSFLGASLIRSDGRTAEWIQATGGKVTRFSLSSGGQIVGNHGVKQIRANNPEETISGYLPPLTDFTESIFIPARRDGIAATPANTNTTLPLNGTNLASYLSTLQLNDTDSYEALNGVVCSAFPYLRRVNARALPSNTVEVWVTHKEDGRAVPLSACGTGLEQLLILLTCISKSPEEALIAIDEPHSFLHPSAERTFLSFLNRFPKKRFLLATHSAVMINSVSPHNVISIAGTGVSAEEHLRTKNNPDIGLILSGLGYENSDLLFNKRLIFVEGPTEAGTLPKLLRKAGIDESMASWLGFPQLEGANPIHNIDDMVKEIARYERLVLSLGRMNMPRLYLLDGDRERNAVGRMNLNENAGFQFLAKPELENYLLQPEAIAKAMIAEGRSYGVDITITPDEVRALLTEYETQGSTKGSDLLSRIYQTKLLRYSKVHSGRLVAEYISDDWPALKELLGELKDFLS